MALVLLTVLHGHAQNTKLGGWDIASFMINPNNTFSIWLETQTRSQKLASDFFYHEFKGGLVYNFPKKNSVMLGIGDYKTYSWPGNFKTPMQSKEFRIWEQLVLNNNIDRVKIEHRYRIEQRWVNGEFRHRFRYRINPVVPLNHATVTARTVYITAFDEVFFTNRSPYFERNRLFAGAGYQFSKLLALQVGWIRQYDYRKNDDGSGKNFLQTSLLFYLDKSTVKREHQPNTLD